MQAPTVLIAASSPESDIIRLAVERAGLRPVIAVGGHHAVELFERELPSVVVLSDRLSAASARDLIRGFYARGGTRVPVILIQDGASDTETGEVRMARPIDAGMLASKIALLSLADELAQEIDFDDMMTPEDAGAAFGAMRQAQLDARTLPGMQPAREYHRTVPDLVTEHDDFNVPIDVDEPGVPVERGDLAGTPLPSLLARLWRGAATGVLSLRGPAGERRLGIDTGFIVAAASDAPGEQLESFLTGEGYGATAEDLGAAEVRAAARRLAQEIACVCFAHESGEWRFSPGAQLETPSLLDVHPCALVVEGIRRAWPAARLDDAIGTRTVVAALPELARVAAAAALDEGQRAAVEWLTGGPATVAEVAARSGLDEMDARALMVALIALGGAVRGGTLPPEDEPAPPARGRILALHARVLDADYFALLGVPREAGRHEIRRACERLRAEFDPERCAPSLREELGPRLDEIVEVVDEAWRVLSDEEVRASYRAHLEDPRLPSEPSKLGTV